jgi:hypothetical protein
MRMLRQKQEHITEIFLVRWEVDDRQSEWSLRKGIV